MFELSPAGEGWSETVLHSFAGGPDGQGPSNGLIIDPFGNLYGTTVAGGDNVNSTRGTVFELSPFGGGWTEQVIYDTEVLGYTGLTMNDAEDIFGVGFNTVFDLSPNGSGGRRW